MHCTMQSYSKPVVGYNDIQNANINLNNSEANVDLLEDEYGISPGQACVFYFKNNEGYKVLGGGWIKN